MVIPDRLAEGKRARASECDGALQKTDILSGIWVLFSLRVCLFAPLLTDFDVAPCLGLP